MIWIEQGQHRSAKDSKHIYICVVNDEYEAFIICTDDGYKAQVPADPDEPLHNGHSYTFDTLEDAKAWCITEIWARRMT